MPAASRRRVPRCASAAPRASGGTRRPQVGGGDCPRGGSAGRREWSLGHRGLARPPGGGASGRRLQRRKQPRCVSGRAGAAAAARPGAAGRAARKAVSEGRGGTARRASARHRGRDRTGRGGRGRRGANGGFSPAPPVPQLLYGGKLDFLVFDYLSEITMSLLTAAKARSPVSSRCPAAARPVWLRRGGPAGWGAAPPGGGWAPVPPRLSSGTNHPPSLF